MKPTNIREYFDKAYEAATTKEEKLNVCREERTVYEMPLKKFLSWMDAHNIGHHTDSEQLAMVLWTMEVDC